MNHSYLVLKSLHVLGVAVFLGNIIVSAWWKVMADRTRDATIIGFAQRQVTLTDLVFTAGGAALTLATGIGMARWQEMDVWHTRWLGWGLGLFIASGLIWVAVLVPVQIIQARLARGFAAGGEIPQDYWRLGRVWMVFGILATVLPLINIFWMVFKPA